MSIPICSAFGAWQTVGDVESYQQIEERAVLLHCGQARVRLDIMAADLVRVRMAPNGTFADDFSWAVLERMWPAVPFQIVDGDTLMVIKTDEIRLHIQKRPFCLTFRSPDGAFISGDDPGKRMAWDGDQIRCWKVIPANEHYFGFGEKTGPLDKLGTSMEMWNSDIPGYRSHTDPVYESVPFFIGLNKGQAHGIYFDNAFRTTFDMGVESRSYYSFGADGGELDYYFMYGPHPKKVVERFTELTGRLPLPPRWALGYQQCRWSYYPESRVREIADTFRRRQIPCDVIYLDIDYMDGFRCFTWDNSRFPDPKKMIDDLRQQGFKVVVIIDPGIKNEPGYRVYDSGLEGDHFCKLPDGQPYVGQVWPGKCVFPDFTRPATRKWWGGLFQGLLDVGIKGFWNDMNEPASWDGPGGSFPPEVIHDNEGAPANHPACHNVYGMQMARSTYEGCLRLRPGERPFVITRAGFAGFQRYTSMWTGDNMATWEDLRMSIPMIINVGLSGQPFAGADIGGFIFAPSGELYTRWLQAGIFNPFCRTHTHTGSPDQEPWSYGTEYERHNRHSIELRYRLLPYLYNTFYEAARTGLPVMRPKWLEFPDEEWTYGHESEFMFGPHMLVAPVLWPGAVDRRFYLPRGQWYDFWTGQPYTGGTDVTVPVDTASIPIFVREGAIIPMQDVVQYSDEKPVDPLVLNIFPAERSTYSLYEDDGLSHAYEEGICALTDYTCEQKDGRLSFHIGKRQGSYQVPRRSCLLQIHSVEEKPHSVKGDNALPEAVSREALQSTPSGWFFQQNEKTVWVKFRDTGLSQTIEIQ